MSHNVFGHLFRVTTFGESHGPGIGCVVDGCPPRIPLEAADIQADLDRRRPGSSRFTTQRREPDEVKILSGVMVDERIGRQVTTGAPIGLFIENVDQRSKDYGDIKDKYRPGHADFTYEAKYGIRDYRGGGRASARETAARVAAGAIARKIVPGVTVRGALVQIGKQRIDRANWDWEEVPRNPFFCPDSKAAEAFAAYLDEIRKSGSSIGAVIEIVAEGAPAGWGAPIYGKLDSELASALMSINAVRASRSAPASAPPNYRVRKTPTKCASAMTASRCSSPITRAAFWAAFRPASRSSRASPSSRPRRSSRRA